MQNDKVTSLSQFTERVSACRDDWHVPFDKELWFRGECKRHDSILRPELYRPPVGRSLKPVAKLLSIENDLYVEFQRCAVQFLDTPPTEETWDWDLYFLMQHHCAPTRLLDWSDGALLALHFALRTRHSERTMDDKPANVVSASASTNGTTSDAASDPRVYVLNLNVLRGVLDREVAADHIKREWRKFYRKHPREELSPERWDRTYLPADKDSLKELPLPSMPFLPHTEHITRRVAAQRSRMMVFGADPSWLSDEFAKSDSSIKAITIDAGSISKIKVQLRNSGVTESVIFPDLDGLGRDMRQRWEDRRLAQASR